MAHTKSALKTIKKSKKRHEQTKAVKSALFTLEKKFRQAVEAKEENAQEIFSAFCTKIDKAAKTNIVHKNKVARKKSRLSALLNAK